MMMSTAAKIMSFICLHMGPIYDPMYAHCNIFHISSSYTCQNKP